MIELYHGDCLEVLKNLPDKSVDMVLTDPPYYVGMTSNSQKATFNELSMLKPFFKELFNEIKRVLKDDGLVYCFTDWRTYPFLQPLINDIIPVKNMLIWDKAGRISPNYGFYHELIIFAGNNKRRICKKNIFKAPNLNTNDSKAKNGERLHTAQKPIELLQELIMDGSDENNVILDCFMGSGSTGVACVNTGRKFIGIELDEHYFKVASDRIMGVKNELA